MPYMSTTVQTSSAHCTYICIPLSVYTSTHKLLVRQSLEERRLARELSEQVGLFNTKAGRVWPQAPLPSVHSSPLHSRLSRSRSCTSRCRRPQGLPECHWARRCCALVGQSRWDSDLHGGCWWWRWCRCRGPCCGPWPGQSCLPGGSARGRTPGLPDAESAPVSAGWPSAAGSWGSSSRPLPRPAAAASLPAESHTRRN